jgi:tight adherence protein C
MLDLVTIAVFLFVLSLVWLLSRMAAGPRPAPPAIAASVMGPLGGAGGADQSGDPLSESLAGQLPPTRFDKEELDKDLRRAGYYRPYARQRFLALRNGLVIFVLIAVGGVAVAIGPEHNRAVMRTLGFGLLAAIACWSVPRIILAINARRRVQRIRAALPDALDAISMCLHGGVSLQDCLAYVGREMAVVYPDLAIELLIANQQADINSFEFAIQQFAARIDAPEVVALAAMVTQNQRLGTGVIGAIYEFADNLRLKFRQMADAKAGRAELLLLLPVVFCLVPSVLLILWGPALLEISDFIRNWGPPGAFGP